MILFFLHLRPSKTPLKKVATATPAKAAAPAKTATPAKPAAAAATPAKATPAKVASAAATPAKAAAPTKPMTPAATPVASSPAPKAVAAASTPVAAAAAPRAATTTSLSAPATISAPAARGGAEVEALQDELEMAKIEKEMAELELEAARAELDELRAGAARSAAGATVDTGDSAAQLTQAIDAVLQLRNEAALRDQELSAALDVMREDRREIQKLEVKLTQRDDQLQAMSQKMSTLRGELDDSAGGVTTVDLLAQIKDMEAAAEAKQSEIADLIQLVSLNDSISEEQRLSEADAIAFAAEESERADKLMSALQQVQTDNGRYKSTVHAMQQDIEELQSGGTGVTTKPAAVAAVVAAPAVVEGGDDVAAAALETKTRSTGIKLKLQTLRATHAESHIDMIKLFLPEAFVTNEYDGVRLAVLFTSLAEKCDIILDDTREQFELRDNIADLIGSSSLTIDQLSFAHDITDIIAHLKVMCVTMSEGLEGADDALYRKLAHSYGELKSHESSVDEVLELMQSGGLGPTVSMEKLRLALGAFNRVASTHLSTALPDYDFARNSLASLADSNRALQVELVRIQRVYSATTTDGLYDSAFAETISKLQAWQKETDALSLVIRKTTRFLPDPAKAAMAFSTETRKGLSDCAEEITALADGIRGAATASYKHMHSSSTLKALSVGQATLHAVANRVDVSDDAVAHARAKSQGAEESMLPLHVKRVFADAGSTLQALCKSLELGQCDAPLVQTGAVGKSSMEKRGGQLKAELAASLQLKSVVEAKDVEIGAEKRAGALLKKTINEFKVKLAGAINQVDRIKEEKDKTIDSLQLQIDESEAGLASAHAEKENQLNASDNERAGLEQRYAELKNRFEKATKGSAKKNAVVDMRAARLKMDSLEHALRVVRAELATLRGGQARTELRELPPLAKNYRVSGMDDALGQSSAKARSLLQSLQACIATPMMVDVTGGGKTASAPAAQLSQQVAKLSALQTQGEQLQADVQAVLAVETSGGGSDSSFSKFLSPSFQKVLRERRSVPKAGVITLPKSMTSAKPGVVALDVDLGQLRAINAVFAR